MQIVDSHLMSQVMYDQSVTINYFVTHTAINLIFALFLYIFSAHSQVAIFPSIIFIKLSLNRMPFHKEI